MRRATSFPYSFVSQFWRICFLNVASLANARKFCHEMHSPSKNGD